MYLKLCVQFLPQRCLYLTEHCVKGIKTSFWACVYSFNGSFNKQGIVLLQWENTLFESQAALLYFFSGNLTMFIFEP